MKKLLFVVVCCLCFYGCGKNEKTTICSCHNNKIQNNEHNITIKHIKNKITYYKNEYKTFHETINKAQDEVDSINESLVCSNKGCFSIVEGENAWKYNVSRDNKTVISIQETNNYSIPYDEELKYLENLPNYVCNEQ